MINRILIGTNALPPQVGGLENLTNDLAIHLHRIGQVITVMVSSDYGFPQPVRKFHTITLDSFLVARLPIPKVSRNNFKYFLSLKKEGINLVILQTHLFVSNWILAIFFRGKSKIVWINYGGGVVKHESRIISLLIEIYEYIGWRILDSCSDIRLAQSEKSKVRFRKQSGQVKIINNCIPDNLINLELRRGNVKDVRRLLFVGRFVQDKRILELLDQVNKSINSLQENHPSVLETLSLTLVGDGPLRERVLQFLGNESRIEWKVQELPDRNSVLAEMLKHDLLIQFPLSEGQPGVTLEALSVGLPILTTPIDECLQKMEGVFVCEEQEFADKLCDMVIYTKKLKVNLERNRQHLRNHHSVENSVSKIFEAI